MEKEKKKDGYKEYLTATERETMLYLDEIRSSAKRRRYEHIDLLVTDLKCYITAAAFSRRQKILKKEKVQ